LSRRSILLLGAAIPLAGCDVFDSPSATEATPAPPHPDELIRARAIGGERELVALYVATAAAYPELESDLERFADRHLRHIAAIEGTVPPQPSGVATPSLPPAQTPEPPEIPADADIDAVVQRLRDAEAAAVDDRRADCLEARDNQLATILASIAACEAAHDRLLRRVG
jgi:hypothetical protein